MGADGQTGYSWQELEHWAEFTPGSGLDTGSSRQVGSLKRLLETGRWSLQVPLDARTNSYQVQPANAWSGTRVVMRLADFLVKWQSIVPLRNPASRRPERSRKNVRVSGCDGALHAQWKRSWDGPASAECALHSVVLDGGGARYIQYLTTYLQVVSIQAGSFGFSGAAPAGLPVFFAWHSALVHSGRAPLSKPP